MGFIQQIKNVFSKPSNRVLRDVWYNNWSQFVVGTLPFGEPIFHNIVEILTDLTNDVTLTPKQGQDLVEFTLFKKFFDLYGQEILNRYFDDGYVSSQRPSSALASQTFSICGLTSNTSTTCSTHRTR